MIVFAYENANYYNPLILSIQRSYPSGAMQSALFKWKQNTEEKNNNNTNIINRKIQTNKSVWFNNVIFFVLEILNDSTFLWQVPKNRVQLRWKDTRCKAFNTANVAVQFSISFISFSSRLFTMFRLMWELMWMVLENLNAKIFLVW